MKCLYKLNEWFKLNISKLFYAVSFRTALTNLTGTFRVWVTTGFEKLA